MPKRSAQEKLERYERKIRKIQERQKSNTEKNRRRIARSIVSSDDEINEDAGTVQIEPETGLADQWEDEHPPAAAPASLESAEPALDAEPAQAMPSPAGAPDEAAPLAAAVQIPDVTPEATHNAVDSVPSCMDLDPELMSALGASTSDTAEFGENIHSSLANLWTPLLKKGLQKEEKDNLLKNYLVPANCKLLQAPKLNAEISAAVSEVVRGRDKKLIAFQQQLGTATAAVNKAMNTLLTSDDKISALRYLSDSCRILADLHHLFSKDRIKLITPSLEKNFLHVIQDTERDETLFGATLGDKIKASKAIEKQGSQIRKVATSQKMNTPQASSSRPAPPGNWSGPPRYSSNRGGRGGQRKATSTRGRTYPPAHPPARSYNQPKTRAQPPQ
ncbi:uncharacterized protein LOC105380262 isoform X2 [Plutella xylostella]|uniref:uncharacterized protein LOC105380262 isoform X2 n=1 Tax=Plutella xylostella TaxID=51655 RepID=UPI002032D5E7|nr:uncharacterized protein LOC105380262 isoform X2 [Plutella xylostella]